MGSTTSGPPCIFIKKLYGMWFLLSIWRWSVLTHTSVLNRCERVFKFIFLFYNIDAKWYVTLCSSRAFLEINIRRTSQHLNFSISLIVSCTVLALLYRVSRKKLTAFAPYCYVWAKMNFTSNKHHLHFNIQLSVVWFKSLNF